VWTPILDHGAEVVRDVEAIRRYLDPLLGVVRGVLAVGGCGLWLSEELLGRGDPGGQIIVLRSSGKEALLRRPVLGDGPGLFFVGVLRLGGLASTGEALQASTFGPGG
jgi:hypothetical protein